MPVTEEVRLYVRQRAHFACEYCGVSEIDGGGELTIDHYRPLSKGGDDGPDNLIYCCVRCNLHKADYWPEQSSDPRLWNPRREPSSLHFTAITDGSLLPLTETGIFTVRRLNLNRRQLIARRRRVIRITEEKRLLKHRYELMENRLREMSARAELSKEQRELLQELLDLLRQHSSSSAGDDDV